MRPGPDSGTARDTSGRSWTNLLDVGSIAHVAHEDATERLVPGSIAQVAHEDAGPARHNLPQPRLHVQVGSIRQVGDECRVARRDFGRQEGRVGVVAKWASASAGCCVSVDNLAPTPVRLRTAQDKIRKGAASTRLGSGTAF